MEYKSSKFHAILAIRPDARFETREENGVEIVTWADGETPISDADISAKQTELATANSHIPNRMSAYPSIQEQLDMQYWDKVNGTDTWEQAINVVKAKYPKA
jgi:hypothetical protein